MQKVEFFERSRAREASYRHRLERKRKFDWVPIFWTCIIYTKKTPPCWQYRRSRICPQPCNPCLRQHNFGPYANIGLNLQPIKPRPQHRRLAVKSNWSAAFRHVGQAGIGDISAITAIHPAPSARKTARPSAVSANKEVAPSCSNSTP